VHRGGHVRADGAQDLRPERDEGTVVLLQDVPPADLEDAVRRAVTLCPSGAISIE
jgi:ferredoxin